MPVLRGEIHPAAKLTNAQVLEIKGLWKIGHRNIRVIAKNYGVSQSNIHKIVSGQTWKHLNNDTKIKQ